jgi:hypothetical protein
MVIIALILAVIIWHLSGTEKFQKWIDENF